MRPINTHGANEGGGGMGRERMILGQRQILNSLNTRRSDTHTWDGTHLSALVSRIPVIPIRSDFALLFARDEIFSFPSLSALTVEKLI